MSESMQKHLAPKRRHRKLTRGFYQFVREQTTGLTDPLIRLEDQCTNLINLLDAKLKRDFQPASISPSSDELDLSQPWSTEWLSFHLNLLSQFGQNLVRHATPNLCHFWLEECFPITRRWDGYLDENLWNSCNLKTVTTAADYVWDMYAVLKKPVMCRLLSYCSTTPTPNKLDNVFNISIPPYLIHSKASTQSTEEASSSKLFDFDPHEYVRFKSDARGVKSEGSRDYISAYLMLQAFGDRFIPNLFDSLATNLRTSPNDFNLKLIDWSRVDDSNLNQLEFKVTFDLSESIKPSNISRTRLHTPPSKVQSRGFQSSREKSASIYFSTDQNIQLTHLRPGSSRYQVQSPNLITLRVRFVPVYSLQSILGRGLLTVDHLGHSKHVYLRPVVNPNVDGDKSQHDLHSWQICSRLNNANLLDKVDLVDRGCRRQSARLVMLLSQIQDSIKPCGLTRYVNRITLIQICFQRLLWETNQTCANQFEFLAHARPKPLAWQRSRLLRCVRGLLEQLYNALKSGQLVSFNGVETNLIKCSTSSDRADLKASCQCIRSWLQSERNLESILNLALDRLRTLDLNVQDSAGLTKLPLILDTKMRTK